MAYGTSWEVVEIDAIVVIAGNNAHPSGFKNEKIVIKTSFAYLSNASMDMANFFRIYSQSVEYKHILQKTSDNDLKFAITRLIRQKIICVSTNTK